MTGLSTSGLEAADRHLAELALSTSDLSPVLRDIAQDAARRNASWWSASRWPPLTAKYAARKAQRYPGRPVEVRTGRLRDSLTRADALTLELGPHTLKLGTDVPYARAQTRRLIPTSSPEQAWRDRVARTIAAAAK